MLGIFLNIKKKVIINQLEHVIFSVTIILNVKVKPIQKHYQLKNALIKLDHT